MLMGHGGLARVRSGSVGRPLPPFLKFGPEVCCHCVARWPGRIMLEYQGTGRGRRIHKKK